MARQGNSFALLIDDESDDMSALLAAVAAKAAAPHPALDPAPAPAPGDKKQSQKNHHPSSANLPSRPLPPNGSGRGGRGHEMGRYGSGGSDAGQFRNGRTNGYQRNISGDSDGNIVDDGFRGHGKGPRGRDRGHGRGGFNQDRGYGNENRVYVGRENQQQGGGDWEEGTENSWKGYGNGNRYIRNENMQFGNENRTSGSEGRGYAGENRGLRGGHGRQYGGRDGTRYGRGEGHNDFEKKEDTPDRKEQTENTGAWNASDVPESTEVPKEAETGQGKPEQVLSAEEEKRVRDEEKRREREEEEKKMTLAQYEKLLSEKRKALEVLKTEERKVVLDKDFEAMQLIDKKKQDEEDLSIKLRSEKDKLKKKDSLEKEEKVRKSVSINEFLKPKYVGRGRGRGGYRGGFSGRSGNESNDPGHESDDTVAAPAPAPAPCIEDSGQFPLLGGVRA